MTLVAWKRFCELLIYDFSPIFAKPEEQVKWLVERMRKHNKRKYDAFVYQPFINDPGYRRAK